jgi:hypothetical protein
LGRGVAGLRGGLTLALDVARHVLGAGRALREARDEL